MSGSAATMAPLAFGPNADYDQAGPFSSRQLTRLDEAVTLSSRESGLVFSVFIGELPEPTRGSAEALFAKLTPDAVLVAVLPHTRKLHIITGEASAERLPSRACALAALSMRASFANGDLVGGIVSGLRMLSDAAGRA